MTEVEKMRAQMETGAGFIAALDQSGGSTPKALSLYGVEPSDYSGDEEMFRAMHDMRARIILADGFTSAKVIGAILFERTMNDTINDIPVAELLWQTRGIVPFLKIDKGLEEKDDGVQLMKPMPDLKRCCRPQNPKAFLAQRNDPSFTTQIRAEFQRSLPNSSTSVRV